MRATRPDCMREVGHSNDAVVAVSVAMLDAALGPVLVASNLDRAAEAVRVGHEKRRFGPVEFNRRMPVLGHIKTHRHGNHGATNESQRSRDVSRNLDLDRLSGQRLAVYLASFTRTYGHPGYLLDGPEKVNQIGYVVGAHVEHRPADRCVVEGRIGMPALVPRAHEKSGCGHRPADGTLVDQLAAGLMRSTQKSVGCASDAQPAIGREVQQSAGLLRSKRERLFRMDVLAGCDG